ncbi:MAG: preprotein translocase subunit YajC [Bifidobacteriaceae bacterium]|nr:preprotein translocase subunit YajC [Bifidobacteriaceae bacterium]
MTILNAAIALAVLADGETTDTGEQSASAGPGNYMMLIFLVGMIALMWFMSRRNKKQQQQQGDFRRTLDVGQRVMTVGGMIGTVTDVQGDVLTIMSPSGDESAYLRRAIKSQVSDEEWANLTAPYPEEQVEALTEAADDAEAADDESGGGVGSGESDDEPDDAPEAEGKNG